MPRFVEAEVQHRLWRWFDETRGCEVWAEVDVGTGRVDLVAATPDDEYWGIEVKGETRNRANISTVEQVHRYIESDALDRVFLASSQIDDFVDLIEDPTHHYRVDPGKCYQAAFSAQQLIRQGSSRSRIISAVEDENPALLDIYLTDDRQFESWIKNLPTFNWPSDYYTEYEPSNPTIEHVVTALADGVEWFLDIQQVGAIRVPLMIERDQHHRVRIYADLATILTSEPYTPPTIQRTAEKKQRDTTISPTNGEMGLHHALWREFWGVPEGALPNPNPAPTFGDRTLNIDLIAFRDGEAAPEVLRNDGKVIGIEAKTYTGLTDSEELEDQLRKYLDTGCLTHLYLAVPDHAHGKAQTIVEGFQPPLDTDCGVIGVDSSGTVRIVSVAEQRRLAHDGYGSNPDYPYHIGYGNAEIPEGPDPTFALRME